MTGATAIVLAMQHTITLELDVCTLRRAIGGGSYVRGADYARQQAVLQTTWDVEDTALRGLVRGQGGNVYETAAYFSLASKIDITAPSGRWRVTPPSVPGASRLRSRTFAKVPRTMTSWLPRRAP